MYQATIGSYDSYRCIGNEDNEEGAPIVNHVQSLQVNTCYYINALYAMLNTT